MKDQDRVERHEYRLLLSDEGKMARRRDISSSFSEIERPFALQCALPIDRVHTKYNLEIWRRLCLAISLDSSLVWFVQGQARL